LGLGIRLVSGRIGVSLGCASWTRGWLPPVSRENRRTALAALDTRRGACCLLANGGCFSRVPTLLLSGPSLGRPDRSYQHPRQLAALEGHRAKAAPRHRALRSFDVRASQPTSSRPPSWRNAQLARGYRGRRRRSPNFMLTITSILRRARRTIGPRGSQ
jgi:hypothetical protein